MDASWEQDGWSTGIFAEAGAPPERTMDSAGAEAVLGAGAGPRERMPSMSGFLAGLRKQNCAVMSSNCFPN